MQMNKKIIIVVLCCLVSTLSIAQNGFKDSILAYHNVARTSVGIENLEWSNELEIEAKSWANYLATNNLFKHSHVQNAGENLWKGTTKAYTYKNMVDTWVNEKEFFVNNTFPDVSTTGDWTVVGHYTQIVWRNTKLVGCALFTANGFDVLVCRYKKPGNVMGQKAF